VSERDPFNSPKEEVERLASELGAVKELLREVSRQLGRLELRVKRAFPATYPAGPREAARGGSSSRPAPTISAGEALRVYEELVQLARTGARGEIQSRLASMGVPDLELMRRELGVSLGSKKPSKKLLIPAIQARISESFMIGQHTDRDRLLSEGSEGNSGERPTRRETGGPG